MVQVTGSCMQKKESFCLTELNGINHWIPKKKESFCPNQQIGINHLVLQKNKIFCLAEQWYKWLDTAQKQKRAEWFESLNSAQNKKE